MTGTLLIEAGRVDTPIALVGEGGDRPAAAITSEATIQGNGSVWNVSQIISIGIGQSGDLLVTRGGTLNTPDLVMGNSEDTPVNAALTVQGADGSQRSTLAVVNDAAVGTLGRGLSALVVRDGALATVGRELSVGLFERTEGVVSVGGRDNNGNSATLRAAGINGSCAIGKNGVGALTISEGGVVRCSEARIGAEQRGIGDVEVSGRGSDRGFWGVLDLFIGTVGRGTLALNDGLVDTAQTFVGPQGRIEGNGLLNGAITVDGGTVAPGLVPSLAQVRRGAQPQQATAPGTLAISGTLTLSNTAVLALDVRGTAADQYDRVTVSGPAKLGGTLRVNFVDGFAPRQGDVFAFVPAGSTEGSFREVTVSGLQPGFQFRIEPDGDLVALNNGISTTQPATPVPTSTATTATSSPPPPTSTVSPATPTAAPTRHKLLLPLVVR